MTAISEFREVCHSHRLAATFQRQVIYDAVMALPGHPSPEAVFERVQRRIPSISLATVYKNIRTFLDRGIFREVSVHHGSMRVEPNHRPHHHFVCTKCKTIHDLPANGFAPVRLRRRLPRGFRVEKFVVDIVGLCPQCSTQSKTSEKNTGEKQRNASCG